MSNENMNVKKQATGIKGFWNNYKEKHPNIAQFLVFFLLSNGVTVLQLVLMPVLKAAFAKTALVSRSFQVLQFGSDVDGTAYDVCDDAAGSLSSGGRGGVAYFRPVQIAIGVAQLINFFAQRSITFKSTSDIGAAASWY